MKTKWLLITLAFLGSTSCTKQMAQYITADPRDTAPDDRTPPGNGPANPPGSSSSNSFGSKFSSGANIAVGTNIKSKFSISVSNRTLTGQSVKSKFTLYQNRPE